MLFRKKQDKAIDEQEQRINSVKRDIHDKVQKDLVKVEKINKVLSNGVTLQVFHAVGGKHGR